MARAKVFGSEMQNTSAPMAEFVPVSSKDKLIYELMPILIGIGPDERLLCYGSCFIASPFMAVTARHVVEELFKQDPSPVHGHQTEYEYWVVQVTWENGQHRHIIWTIDSVSTSLHSDIAIIWLRALDENAVRYRAWKAVPMTL